MEKVPRKEKHHVTYLRLKPTNKIQLAKLVDFLNKAGFDVDDVDNKFDKERSRVLEMRVKINGSGKEVRDLLESDSEYADLGKRLLGSV